MSPPAPRRALPEGQREPQPGPRARRAPAASASPTRAFEALQAVSGLEPELAFLELLEPEDRKQWLVGWLVPRSLRPRLRAHLRQHALLLELDEVTELLTRSLLRAPGMGLRGKGGTRGGSRPPSARGRLPALELLLATSCRRAARRDTERALGQRPCLLTPRLLAIEGLTGLRGRAACAWLARLHAAPLSARRPWQERLDHWGSDESEVEPGGPALASPAPRRGQSSVLPEPPEAASCQTFVT